MLQICGGNNEWGEEDREEVTKIALVLRCEIFFKCFIFFSVMSFSILQRKRRRTEQVSEGKGVKKPPTDHLQSGRWVIVSPLPFFCAIELTEFRGWHHYEEWTREMQHVKCKLEIDPYSLCLLWRIADLVLTDLLTEWVVGWFGGLTCTDKETINRSMNDL